MKLNDILNIAARKPETGSDNAAAKCLGYRHSTISHWRTNKRAPDADACVALSRFTGVPLEEVINAAREARQEKKRMGKRGQLALSLSSYAAAICVGLSTLSTVKSVQANEIRPLTYLVDGTHCVLC